MTTSINMNYVNTMVSNLVSVHFLANKTRVPREGLRDNIPAIAGLVRRSLKDSSVLVREAAQKVETLLRDGGIDVETVPAAAPPAPPVVAAPPSVTVQSKASLPEWIAVERLAVDACGPMAAVVVSKLRASHPESSPRVLRTQFTEAFGEEVTSQIFARVR